MSGPLAHSARKSDGKPQAYAEHVRNVQGGAEARAARMLDHCRRDDPKDLGRLKSAITDAAVYHDLGKLDPDTQDRLAQGRGTALEWDHIDAGVAHLMDHGAKTAAWLVRAHHAPGLPANAWHFSSDESPKLRGRRNDNEYVSADEEQIARTNRTLAHLLDAHERACGSHAPTKTKTLHGLSLRLALSCLVDADHADTAHFDTGWEAPESPQPRWQERLDKLDAYVRALQSRPGDPDRKALRRDFYEACRCGPLHENAMLACEGSVGIGKTTALAAFALRKAMATGARRIIIVAPFTTILTQNAKALRKALTLDHEVADEALAEHHHRADFSSLGSRDLASLWSAPIILTTAVQFFETLAANRPAELRKLHSLPGSVVVIDEAHAALPTPLLQQNWRWMRELASDWNSTFVFASGSLARFWEMEDVVGEDATATLPEIVPAMIARRTRSNEARRLSIFSLGLIKGGSDALARILDEKAAEGTSLVIMNTVQSAAVLAKQLRKTSHRDVCHLSTALSPADRAKILNRVRARLRMSSEKPFTLVATSLVEAGVDLSFHAAFRERSSVPSLIQTGGRVNRHAELTTGGRLFDFVIDSDKRLTVHPGVGKSAECVDAFFKAGRFSGDYDPASLVSDALRMETEGFRGRTPLSDAEAKYDYPLVSNLSRLITTDTRIVVVDPGLRERLEASQTVSTRDILNGSVQIYSTKIRELGLQPVMARSDLYWWPHTYDPKFLGYMDGALYLKEIAAGNPVIV